MTRHEIDIEGLPEGWEPVGAKVGCPSTAGGDLHVNAKIFIKRKVRKYDWGKTLDDALVQMKDATGYHLRAEARRCLTFVVIAPIWQPNIHGKCPVDPDASIVKVRLADGREREWDADVVNWSLSQKHLDDLVTAWQFIRLADGYEW